MSTGSGGRPYTVTGPAVARPWSPRSAAARLAAIQLGDPLTVPVGFVTSLAFDSDGRTLATGSDGGMAVLWDLTDRDRPARIGKPLTPPSDFASWVAFTNDGHTLATTSESTVVLWM